MEIGVSGEGIEMEERVELRRTVYISRMSAYSLVVSYQPHSVYPRRISAKMTPSIISDFSSSTPTEMIPLGAYIFYRLREIGISHVFGCPGDFNLNLLDHLYTVPSMKWVGTCNELNGAYAADGYARIRGIPGALITTYGVGELSAINGIGGAYSEHIPIIHIVGTTSRQARRDKIMIHHTLDEDWDHDTFQHISAPVRQGHAFLLDDATFTKEVDAVLEKCVKSRRPAYLYVPMDTPDILVDASPLSTPLDFEIRNDGMEDEEDEIIEEIIKKITEAKIPTILTDVLAHRYGAAKDVHRFMDSTKFPVSSPISPGE
jgi:pyruvate decarboxylase